MTIWASRYATVKPATGSSVVFVARLVFYELAASHPPLAWDPRVELAVKLPMTWFALICWEWTRAVRADHSLLLVMLEQEDCSHEHDQQLLLSCSCCWSTG